MEAGSTSKCRAPLDFKELPGASWVSFKEKVGGVCLEVPRGQVDKGKRLLENSTGPQPLSESARNAPNKQELLKGSRGGEENLPFSRPIHACSGLWEMDSTNL